MDFAEIKINEAKYKRKGSKMSKKPKNPFRRALLFLTGSLVFFLLLGFVIYGYETYSDIMNEKIFDAGAESLEETYGEVCQSFLETSRARWNYLKQLDAYLRCFEDGDADAADTALRHIEGLMETYGFTDFYLLSDNGGYRNLKGEEGFIDLGKALFTLMDDKQEIMMDGSLPRRENMMFYAVPVEEATFDGFTYCALAFGYDKEAMSDILSVSAYQGTSESYIVYANGRAAMSMSDDQLQLKNVLSLLEDYQVSEETVSQVEKDLDNGDVNTVEVTIDGTSYYLSYQSLGFQEWMLVSFTPTGAANLAMNDIRMSTTRLMIVSLGVIFTVLMIVLIFLFWRSVSRKNRLIAERELIFDMMAQNLDDIYMLFRLEDHEPLYVSPNIHRLLGISQKEFYEDAHVMQQVCPEKENWVQESVLDNLLPGESIQTEAQLVSRATGEKSLYNFRLYRPTAERRNVVIGIISNRSKEQQVRQQIQDALASANAANEAKTAFFSNMSHDIRTPMNAIVGFSALLEKYADDPVIVRDYIKKITSSSRYLLQLINDVLDMSKIESGKASLNLGEADVRDVISEAENIMRPQMEAKGQTFSVEKNLEFEGTVQVDQTRLAQVFLNILSNAMKYTPGGGSIVWTIDSYTTPQSPLAKYRFIIQDDGIGMSEDFQKDIFSAFSREESSVTNKVQGTGLGMAITRNLVDMMGGTIQVESQVGQGSTFTVFLDFCITDSYRRVTEQKEKELFSIRGMHILAAEDNDLNSEILAELLASEGAFCDICCNGREIVEKFESSAPDQYDLILMDIQMPVMNGYEASESIRASAHPQAKTIPIIAMTANAFTEDIQNAINAGMDAHLAKPIDMRMLKEKLASVYVGG